MDRDQLQRIIIKNRIRDYRRERAITQEGLAEAVGVSRQSIISVETGKCLPSVPLALAIARFFHSPLETLFIIDASSNQLKQEDTMVREISPFRGVSSLHEAIDRMFDDALAPAKRGFEGIVPRLDVYQTEKELLVEADVPGLTEDQVDIEVQDGVLTIKGERTEEQEEKNREYFHREVSYGSFHRALTLPVEVLPEKATATVKDGHLKVVLPKVEPQKPKVHKLKPQKGA